MDQKLFKLSTNISAVALIDPFLNGDRKNDAIIIKGLSTAFTLANDCEGHELQSIQIFNFKT